MSIPRRGGGHIVFADPVAISISETIMSWVKVFRINPEFINSGFLG